MLPSFKKPLAASLIFGLVFPYISYAEIQTNIEVNISTDTNTETSDSLKIKAKDISSPDTNFDAVAPSTVSTTNSGRSTTTTTTLPQIDADGAKPEGAWNFTVSRQGELVFTSRNIKRHPIYCLYGTHLTTQQSLLNWKVCF